MVFIKSLIGNSKKKKNMQKDISEILEKTVDTNYCRCCAHFARGGQYSIKYLEKHNFKNPREVAKKLQLCCFKIWDELEYEEYAESTPVIDKEIERLTIIDLNWLALCKLRNLRTEDNTLYDKPYS